MSLAKSMRLTYRYRLYPTRGQAEFLSEQLIAACDLYNGALQERIGAWRMSRKSVSYYSQTAQLKAIRANGDSTLANFACCQDVLRRVDRTFKAFYRRVKTGKRPGFPRWRSVSRYDSITFPAYGNGCRLLGSALRIHGAGVIKVKLHRPLEGDVKTVTVKREAGKWFACFSVVVECAPLHALENETGIDLGLTSFAVLSDGTAIENPRYHRKAEARLRLAQRKIARRQKGSRRRRNAVLLLQRAHVHVRNQRSDFHHKAARALVNGHGLIGVENLNVKGLAAGWMAKSIHDAGWSQFLDRVRYKAEKAGRCMIEVDARHTSQVCVCGATVPKTLVDRWHHCYACGLSLPRDHASAQVILLRARTAGMRSGIWPRPDQPSNANVEGRASCVV